MTIKHLYPVVEPSLNLDFANSKKLDPRITFTRGSIGTYVGEDGLIKTAAQDEARFDHDSDGNSLGLLIEESRTNGVRYSQDFTDALWVKTSATIIPNSVIAPDGTLTGSTMKADAGTAILPSVIQNAGDAAIRTLSLYAKMGTYRYLKINPRGHQYALVVDLQDGSVYATGNTNVISADIIPAPNGWYRLILTTDNTSPTRTFAIRFSTNANTNATFDFDGTETVHIWGAQLETGSFPTSYIPTSGSTVTRAADVASITGSNFSSWYRQEEGTVFAEAATQLSGTGHVLTGFSTGSFASSAYLVKNGSNLTEAAPNASPSNLSIQLQSVTNNTLFKSSLAFTAGTGSASAAMNAGTVGTDASTGIPTTMSQMSIGSAPWNFSTQWNGTLRRLTYWPQRLPDATLQALTL